MSELEEIRKGISAVDEKMARLFVERMELVGQVAAYKKANGLPVKDTAREAAVLDRNSRLVDDPVMQEYYVPFLQDVISYSCAYQERLLNEMKVAYCGVPGAFAHIAAKRLYPTARLVAFQDFESAYKA